MKILVVHNAYQSHQLGGEDIEVAREIAALKANLGEQNVLSYIVSNDDIKLPQLALNIWGDKTHARNIANIVLEHKIELVHVHNFFPLLTPLVFKAIKELGVKVIHTLHNFRWWCLSGILYRSKAGACEQCVGKNFAFPAVAYKCYRDSFLQSLAGSLAFAWYQLKEYAEHIDAYFVLSHFQMEKVKPLVPNGNIFLKPNLIEPPDTIFPVEQKKDYLFVGRLEAAKGIEILLSTWHQLPSHFHLNVIGTANHKKYEQEFSRDNISFLGQMPHEKVLDYMAKAKYLLHSSLAYETFGLTMVESLARGTPVIGFDIGTRSEFVQNGQNGFLCDEAHFKQTILDSLTYENYDHLSLNAFERAKGFYSQTVIKKQIALYQRVLEQ